MATANLPISVSSTGSWANTGNIFAADGVFATATVSGYGYTDMGLTVTNNLPAGSIISSVVLNVRGKTSVTGSGKLVLLDASFYPYKICDLTTTNADFTHSYGTTVPSFLYAEASEYTGTTSIVYLDYLAITVTYTPPAASGNALFLGENF